MKFTLLLILPFCRMWFEKIELMLQNFWKFLWVTIWLGDLICDYENLLYQILLDILWLTKADQYLLYRKLFNICIFYKVHYAYIMICIWYVPGWRAIFSSYKLLTFCLPQMQVKRQELVTWEHGPPTWRTWYTLTHAMNAQTNIR